jgi:hypothetical protein
MMFSIFATLVLWKINPRTWLEWYFEACAANGGRAADNPASFFTVELAESTLGRIADFDTSRHRQHFVAPPDLPANPSHLFAPLIRSSLRRHLHPFGECLRRIDRNSLARPVHVPYR